jgi:hypothetical protein
MRYASLTLALLAMAGCEATEPYLRAGTWRPTGTNDLNIAAQIIRPSDLVRGVDYAPLDGTMATAAVERYRLGKIKKLPDTSLVGIGNLGSGNTGSDATAPAAGGTAAP